MQDVPLVLDALVEAPPVQDHALGEKRLRAMVEAHFAFVWRSMCHLGVPEADAEDAAQQVFLVASRRLAAIAIGKERAFLFGTAIKVAAHARRDRARRREIVAPELDLLDAGPNPEELLDRARAHALLEDALEAMDPDERAAYVLFEIEQLSKSEVAELLGIPEGTVASRVRRAREEFRAHLRRFEARCKVRGGSR
jgi:RNA polymerase sigma-70 factor (ECF subfamily)